MQFDSLDTDKSGFIEKKEFIPLLKEFYAKLTEEQKNGLNTMLKDNPYVWVSLTYNYKVDIPGLEDYVFDTPWVISNVISNPFAAK